MSQRETNDPGLGEVYEKQTQRIINADGSFNIRRQGLGPAIRHVYQFFIHITWPQFIFIILTGYLIGNVLFALLYVNIGIEGISGTDQLETQNPFLIAIFFSFQTFTTVGYGLLSPTGTMVNWVASVQSMLGFMSFSIATGLLYGRFSRPSAKILFSKNILLAPFGDGYSLMFRIVNMRPNVMMEMDAKIMLTTTKKVNGQYRRSYSRLKLSLDHIEFFPLNWTLVHPIDEDSPFYGKSPSEIMSLHPEILVLLKGFDETFSQTVHSRYSYTLRDMVFNAKFLPAFHTDSDGTTTIDVRKIHDYQKIDGKIGEILKGTQRHRAAASKKNEKSPITREKSSKSRRETPLMK